MKFKHRLDWERKTTHLILSKDEILALILPAFGTTAFKQPIIEQFNIIASGLANTNVFFRLKDNSQCFLLRIYNRDKNALKLEMALSERFGQNGQNVPMPEFVYYSNTHPKYCYAIQKWVPGKHLYEIIDNLTTAELENLGAELATVLNNIANHRFPKAGFFDENLNVIPFEKSAYIHPFLDYIKECLQADAGIWLGEALSDKVWDFVLENQDYFPSLDNPGLVHADFNQDNIIIDEKTLKVAVLVDWEFAYSGSYLYDIGTLFRFDLPEAFKESFIQVYENLHGKLDNEWQKMIKIQDIANFMGLLTIKDERPNRIRDIKALLENTMKNFAS